MPGGDLTDDRLPDGRLAHRLNAGAAATDCLTDCLDSQPRHPRTPTYLCAMISGVSGSDVPCFQGSFGSGRRGGPVHSWYTSRARNVYLRCMSRVRTNIEIEDDYVRVIMDRYGVHTKTEAVDLALRHLAGQPMTRDQALALRGARAIGVIPLDTAPRGVA